MRVIIQRVSEASVVSDGVLTGHIGKGFLILLGIETRDDRKDVEWLVKKITGMRIFQDENDKMNLSIQDIKGAFLVVSQFTLFASMKKGNRPSFIYAARPEQAVPLYEYFIESLRTSSGLPVDTGIFGADMKISLVNDGPVTIILDSRNPE